MIKTAAIGLALTGAVISGCKKIDDFVNKGFDAELFRKNLKAACDGKTVGYSFAISQNGKIVKYDFGGEARNPKDGEVDYEILTRQGTGSCSKTITAFAILQALEDKGQNEKARLVDLLPAWWNIPEENNPLTVALLLQHYAGLQHVGDGDYQAIRATMQQPTTGYGKAAYVYRNGNYSICRVLLYCIVNGTKGLEGLSDAAADEVVSQFHRTYVREKIFKKAGIPDWSKINVGPWNESGTITPKNMDRRMTLYYNFKQPGLSGITTYTTYLEAGPGGWYMNSPEMAAVLAAGEEGKLVSDTMMKKMKEDFMGYDRTITGKHGAYYYKNGVWADSLTRGVYTVVMHFPNNVQVAWHSNARNTNLGSPEALIKNAYDDAWR
ncbi:hypothetical protein CCY01nite_32600 [Chitinophaga cymbidii]|uniref:Beta-lactamase-related domain-containing protein n=2 Tax=Chitinophaga cymbidii TaxID=1096750 RepID=A0A512RMT6_9BACT|nr:hypothetical protein CCY01nite_32600 [Chitinophaga cymbidii]